MNNLFKNFLSRKSKIQEGRVDILHDIKTPLSSLKNGIEGVSDRLDALISAYEMALKARLPVPTLYPQELDALRESLSFAKRDIYYSVYYINFLSTTYINFDTYLPELKKLSVKDSLKKIIHFFPWKNQTQKDCIHINEDFKDFEFFFDETLFNAIIIPVMHFMMKSLNKYEDNSFTLRTSLFSRYNQLDLEMKSNGNPREHLEQFKSSSWFDYCKKAVGKFAKFEMGVIDNGIRCTVIFQAI